MATKFSSRSAGSVMVPFVEIMKIWGRKVVESVN